MWGDHSVILGILATASIALVVYRFNMDKNSEFKPNATVGKCMTIGDREVQEDSFSVVENRNGLLVVLTDGIGKSFGGRIAGRIAIEKFMELFSEGGATENPHYYFRQAFHAANRAILEKIDEDRGGACVAAAVIRDNVLYHAIVGSSRIAVYRNGDLVPVTEGHTISVLAQQKFKKGEITRDHAVKLLERNRLYNYVGQDGFKDIEVFMEPIHLRSGDVVVLMSDGIYECLAWHEIESKLALEDDCDRMAFSIVEAVNKSKKQSKDNASIVLLRI